MYHLIALANTHAWDHDRGDLNTCNFTRKKRQENSGSVELLCSSNRSNQSIKRFTHSFIHSFNIMHITMNQMTSFLSSKWFNSMNLSISYSHRFWCCSQEETTIRIRLEIEFEYLATKKLSHKTREKPITKGIGTNHHVSKFVDSSAHIVYRHRQNESRRWSSARRSSDQ